MSFIISCMFIVQVLNLYKDKNCSCRKQVMVHLIFPFPVFRLFECSSKMTTFAVESKSSGYEQAISGRSAEL